MPITCKVWKPTRFDVLRWTRTRCGVPIYGPNATWVTDMPMSVQVTRNMSETTAEPLTRPDGTICLSLPTTQSILNYTLTIGLCGVDPAMMAAMNDSISAVHNYLAEVVGWDETSRSSDIQVASEGWMTPPATGGSCATGTGSTAVAEWPYMGFYSVTGIVETGDVTYGTELTPFTITGTAEVGSGGWGHGPYDVQLQPTVPPVPGPWIDIVPSDAGNRKALVDVPPPEPTCGPIPLSNPDAPLVLITRGANAMTECVSTLADGGEWVVDFGDGSPTQVFAPDEEVCYTYTTEGCYTVGVWAQGNDQLYRGERICLPQTLTLDIVPSSGAVPLDVVATIGGASGMSQPTLDWGDV